MRRVRRILLNALTVLSPLLCVATCALWHRSERKTSVLFRTRPSHSVLLQSSRGRFVLRRQDSDLYREATQWRLIETPWKDYDSSCHLRGYPQPEFPGIGISYLRKPADEWGVSGNIWLFRYWLIASLLSVMPLYCGAAAVRRVRRGPVGHCTQCSYDLTANVSGACPECGLKVPITEGACA